MALDFAWNPLPIGACGVAVILISLTFPYSVSADAPRQAAVRITTGIEAEVGIDCDHA